VADRRRRPRRLGDHAGRPLALAVRGRASGGSDAHRRLYFAIFGTGTILLDGLVAAFVVVYATDMRVRREGLDLVP